MKHFDVPAMIRAGARAEPHRSVLDAVMGEDWAHLDLGGPMGLQKAVDLEIARRKDQTISVSVAGKTPQAMVKLIGRGGAANAQGLNAQMSYLARDGDVPLIRSEVMFDMEIDEEQRANIADQWGLTSGNARIDRTSHFVVSFPAATNLQAAELAGRAWAETLLGSGRYGDTWDYYTAYHTDTANPHMHVVVCRKGLDHDRWLKVSRRSGISFDVLREVQVDAALAQGIVLAAHSRLSRGLHTRPVPAAEYRAAQTQGRTAVAPAHSPETAIIAAATILHFAREYRSDALLIETADPQMSRKIMAVAEALRNGQSADMTPVSATLPTKENLKMAETIDGLREQLRETYIQTDREIREIEDRALRVRFERTSAAQKSGSAHLLPDDPDILAHARPAAGLTYEGFAGDDRDPAVRQAKERVAGAIRQIAQEAGLDPEVALARFDGPAVSQRLSRDWQRAEREEIAAAGGISAPDREEARAVAAMQSEFHAKVSEIHRAELERTEHPGLSGHASGAGNTAEASEPDKPVPRPRMPDYGDDTGNGL